MLFRSLPIQRWPANVMHDGCCDDEPWARYFYCPKASKTDRDEGCEHLPIRQHHEITQRKEGSKGQNNPRSGMSSGERHNHHPTVKPTDLMRYLCRLVTPLDGIILDPFAGSGSTGKAAMLEGFNFVGCELDPAYAEIAQARIDRAVLEWLVNKSV